MAQQPDQQEIDPLTMLSMTLQQDAADLTEEAAARMIRSSAEMIQNETVADGGKIITNSDIDALYDRVAGTKVIAFLPAGTNVDTKNSNARVEKDPSSGKLKVIVPHEPVKTNVDPAQTARNVVQQAGETFPSTFDVEKEMAKLKDKRGEELASGITTLLSTLDTHITKRKIQIGEQASVESGYAAAKAALERSLQAEHIPNPNFGGMSFNQRFGFASAQTQQAETFANTTRIQMMALEKSMIEKDLEISKYASARNAILKMEMRTAQRQMAEDDKLDAITSSMVANYKFVYGSSDMDDLTARRAIAARVRNDPIVAKTVMLTPDNVYATLLDPELKVRDNAFKLVLKYDVAANNLDPNTTQTPITERIKEFIKEPIKLLDAGVRTGTISKEEAKQLNTQWIRADTKERASLQQGAFAALLEKYIERQYETSYQNVKKWRANEVDPSQPLGQVADRIAKSNTNGIAHLPTVVDMFIRDTSLKDPETQAILTHAQKMDILESALSGTISNDFKTILYPNTDSLKIKMANSIKNIANKSHIRMKLDMWRQEYWKEPYAPFGLR